MFVYNCSLFQINGDYLPDLVIINILQFLPVEDLVLRIPEVSPRFSKLSLTPTLWRDIVYAPPDGVQDAEILSLLKKAPLLRHLELDHADDLDDVLKCLVNHCKDIRTFRIKWKKGPVWLWVPILVKAYDKLESLECYVPGKNLTLDYMRYLGNVRDGKCFVLTDLFGQVESKSYGGNFYLLTIPLPIERVENFFLENDGLQHIAIGSNLTQGAIDRIYDYGNLKSLFMYSDDSSEFNFDIARLSSIPTLENIHLNFVHRDFVAIFNPLVAVQFPRLVKLEILCKKTHLQIPGLLASCRNLEFLKILSKDMTDADLDGLEQCRNLKHLDLSFNEPGFTNATLTRIAQGCQELVFLDVSYPAHVNEYRYNLELLRPCLMIRYLRLNFKLVSDGELRTFPNIFPNLMEIFMNNSGQFSEEEVLLLESHGPRLRVFLSELQPQDHL